jgi:hypothetical protein
MTANYRDVTTLLLNGGKVSAPTGGILPLIQQCDGVLLGMSSPATNAGLELVAGRMALDHKKPLAFLADAFSAWKRPWFDDLKPYVSLLFVVNEAEATEAKLTYPHTKIVACGNPEWAKYFEPADRNASRGLVDANKSEIVVLIPFIKDWGVNIDKATMALHAIASMSAPNGYRAVINLHPGDKATLEAYQHELGRFVGGPFQVVFSKESADALIPGADVVMGPSTSASIHAMARGIPLIDVMSRTIRAWVMQDIGSDKTYASQNGGSIEVVSSSTLSILLHTLAKGTGAGSISLARMREKQPLLVPRFKADQVLKTMTDALLKL